MSKWKSSTLFITFAFLALIPLLLDKLYADKQYRKDLRNDELVAKYECDPLKNCIADFNRDGNVERIVVKQNPEDRFDLSLVVFDGEKELLKLPYDHTDGTLRTHTAIRQENGEARLLVYDKISRKHTVAVFAWNGNELSEACPAQLDCEILSAMAARDDTGGWNERTFRPLERAMRLAVCYLFVAALVGYVIYRRRQKMNLDLP